MRILLVSACLMMACRSVSAAPLVIRPEPGTEACIERAARDRDTCLADGGGRACYRNFDSSALRCPGVSLGRRAKFTDDENTPKLPPIGGR